VLSYVITVHYFGQIIRLGARGFVGKPTHTHDKKNCRVIVIVFTANKIPHTIRRRGVNNGNAFKNKNLSKK